MIAYERAGQKTKNKTKHKTKNKHNFKNDTKNSTKNEANATAGQQHMLCQTPFGPTFKAIITIRFSRFARNHGFPGGLNVGKITIHIEHFMKLAVCKFIKRDEGS